MPYLRFASPKAGTRFITLDKDVISVGRGPDCDIVLEDNMASRRHAEVKKVGVGYIVVDLNSKNGTLVNGSPISSWTLNDGDLISIGSSQLMYKLSR